jgi:uncharacterized protein (TIGR03086 family)
MRMEMISQRRLLHRRALDLATAQVAAVRPDDLTRPTPCGEWDLAALLAHMIGQNHGFAAAIRTAGAADTVGLDDFRPRPAGAGPLPAWIASADDVTGAIAGPGPGRVYLPEISTEVRFPVDVVVGFHLLDSAVHAWDVATALGRPCRPDPEVADAVLEQARLIPDTARTRAGAAFAAALPTAASQDSWTAALAIVGRRPDGRTTGA